jgi:hypothetical protein
VESIRAALAYIPAHDRQLWVHIGMAIKSALGEDGFELWNQWSQQAESYIAADAQVTWRSIKPVGGITIATLYHEAKKWGFNFDGEHRPGPVTPEQQKLRQREIEQAEADELARRTQARERAGQIWDGATLELGNHKYLREKRVHAHGIRNNGRELIIPMRDTAGILHNLQFIDPNGGKRFLAGGRVSGCFHAIGKPKHTLCVAEGYGTAAAIYESTGLPVAVAFTAGNLKPAAKALRETYLHVRLIICGDNDLWTAGNPGITKANEAAIAANADVAIPQFQDLSGKPTDFNDLARMQGAGSVRKAIKEAKPPADHGPKPHVATSTQHHASGQGWPEPLAEEAYHGLAGKFVRTIEPHTEADPAAILLQFLVAFGSIVGRGSYFAVEGDQHTTNLFTVMVGPTSKGRKGTSWGRVQQTFSLVDDSWTGDDGPWAHVDDPWVKQCLGSGLSSGEGLISAVRDPVFKREKQGKGSEAQYEEVMVDEGVADKRLLVIEPEFASTLRVMARAGNTLSPVIRQAWDRGDLRIMTKNSPARATDAHISIIGHVTVDELRRYLDRTEVGNGFANRFLFICVRRSKCLPEGGSLQIDELAPHAKQLAQAIGHARTLQQVKMDEEARTIWRRVYPELSEGLPGLFGAVISRAEAQVVRLSLLYALLGQSDCIRAEHLQAALAVWEYVEGSARYIFGSALGDPMADEILRSLRTHPEGLTRTDISALFKRHKDTASLGQALDLLEREGLAKPEHQETGGRRVEVWRVC